MSECVFKKTPKNLHPKGRQVERISTITTGLRREHASKPFLFHCSQPENCFFGRFLAGLVLVAGESYWKLVQGLDGSAVGCLSWMTLPCVERCLSLWFLHVSFFRLIHAFSMLWLSPGWGVRWLNGWTWFSGVLGVPNGSTMTPGEGRNRKLNSELANGRLVTRLMWHFGKDKENVLMNPTKVFFRFFFTISGFTGGIHSLQIRKFPSVLDCCERRANQWLDVEMFRIEGLSFISKIVNLGDGGGWTPLRPPQNKRWFGDSFKRFEIGYRLLKLGSYSKKAGFFAK